MILEDIVVFEISEERKAKYSFSHSYMESKT
jgi:hypothetical protein